MPLAERHVYEPLLAAILNHIAGHQNQELDRFRLGLVAAEAAWWPVRIETVPAAALIAPDLPGTDPRARPVIAAFTAARPSLKWEQTYSRSDGVIGEDMVRGYCFAEVIGKRGPFVSDRIRAGVGVFGPGVVYPPHRHVAEEVYIPLAGSATFTLGKATPLEARASDVVFVRSSLTHGLVMGPSPFVVLYLWRGGDLREKSTFDRARSD